MAAIIAQSKTYGKPDGEGPRFSESGYLMYNAAVGRSQGADSPNKALLAMATVRPVTNTEFETAVSLLERFFAEEGFRTASGQIRTQLAALLDHDESTVFLAWLGEIAVGVATVTTSQGIELGLSAELEDLYVLPQARGFGVGTALIEATKDWCRSRGCSLVSVVVTPEGQTAHDLLGYYGGRGFRETGRTLLFAYLERETDKD